MPMWGTKKWQLLLGIAIIFIFGYGTYTILADIIAGHPIWWYNASFILFALTLLGLLLLVRQGWETLRNVATYGFNPSPSGSLIEEKSEYQEDRELLSDIADDANRENDYYRGESE